MSPEKSPKSSVHLIVPETRIKEICESYSLDAKGQCIIDRVLVRWEDITFDTEKMIQIFFEEAKDYQEKGVLIRSLLEINLEFINRNPMHPLGKRGRKAPNN